MRKAITYAVGLGCVGVAVVVLAQEKGQSPAPNPDSQYRLGPDSLPQEGVPKGEIRGPYALRSRVYAGTQHTYWVYVPAQYDPSVPAALMVFQDGQAFKDEKGDMRAQNVMDNLIYRREIPVMIGVFINPGRRPDQPEPTLRNWGDRDTNRPTEYNSLDDRYARVITEELIPALQKDYNISKDPEMHGIGGSSSGAIAAFTVAWERPNDFRKVLSNVGSFVNLRGGHVYPEKVLASEKKPIRVYLCDGRNDNRGLRNGKYDEKRDWFYQNVRLMKALTQKGYDVNYSWGMNRHGQKFGGAILPDMLRWLWRDGPVSTDANDLVERAFNQAATRKKMAVLAAGATNDPASQPGLISSQFLFEKAPFASAHASTIVETKSGLLAAWFGGSDEGNPDVGIWTSRNDGKGWTPPVEVTRWDEVGKRLPCWNPVLFQPRSGLLWLFYKAGPTPANWWGMLISSTDDGKTWSKPKRLPDGFLGPVKNKPIALKDGSILAPTSFEDRGWRVHFERTSDLGETWQTVGPVDDDKTWEAIQPTLLTHPDGRIQALSRSQQSKIVECWSADGGKTWSKLVSTSLPNPDSGIDAVTLADGRHLLVYNPTTKGRSPLTVAISPDGKNWKTLLVLEDQPGEYSYPAVIQASDGLVHITYTWHRKKIRYVVVDPQKLVPHAAR